MDESLREMLKIPYSRLDDINAVLLNSDTQVVNDFLGVVARYGTPEEINQKAQEARQLPNLIQTSNSSQKPEYLESLRWLEEMRDQKAFISVPEYRRKVLGERAGSC